jgi:acyl transferase domain-containing protein/NADPH:quinone reductase-like Zn-dependent oxidoreductase/NAD(P)-dependent dehydrogenase (short-subunit alcohol dehydrogenase family)
MDPQQRLLLEVVYEALENGMKLHYLDMRLQWTLTSSIAGITMQEISGTSTSVFAGSFTNDYDSMMAKDLEQYPKYMVTGTGKAILSNRISYFYNLHGSSATIDTACSSSLVCFDLGNKSLQNGESDISIIVGSALHFDPNIYIIMTDLGMLSTDGRCRAFDEAASGYVRGEGVVAAVLRKKSTAIRHGDNIKAVVRASLTNHDGKKNGITLPSSEAQEALMRKTYEINNLDPAETAYFEAHGTGTQAGDPLEARAIGAVFGSKDREPLYVGSVKTNIGHLEGASGLSGIMKAVLALEHKTIPPNMLFNNPSHAIKFDDWGIQVPTTSIPWDAPNGIRRASVNSFGYGGTNGHVVLEGYYPRESQLKLGPSLPESLASMTQKRPYLLPLSSHSAKAGKLLTEDLTKYLVKFSDTKVLDFVYSLSLRRSMHQHRSFAIGSDVPSIMQDMTTPQPIAKWIPSGEKAPRLGFVFTGQGGQWWGMGRQLLLQSPLFKQTMKKCDNILASLPDFPDWSIVEELSRTKESTRLGETKFSQPICTALQLGILAMFEAWGIHPSAVVGHSSGEMAAAYSAGILSFRNTIIAAYYRGLYMSNGAPGTSPPGSMVAIGLSEQAAIEELKEFNGRIAVAAINSPSNVTVSGDLDAVLELKATLTERKIFARQLQVAQAFHSHHMLPLAPPYLKALETCEGFEPKKPKTRMFSSVRARVADYETMGPSYWCDNMTNAVRFSDALTGILLDEMDEQNIDVLVEIGPHPALKGPSRQTVQALKLDIPYIASLTRDVPDFEGLLQSAGQLFALGYPVDLSAANSDHFISEDGHVQAALNAQRLKNLPTYSWDHSRYWSETRVIRDHRLRKHRQIILGAPIPGHIPNNPRWRNYLRQSELPWLVDHKIEGKVIFPAAGYISMAVEAITRLDSRPTEIKAIALKDIVVKSALIVSEKETGTEVVVELKPSSISAKSSSDEWYEFFIYSFDDAGRCSENCRGLISNESGSPGSIDRMEPFSTFSELQSHSHRRVAPHKYYDHLSALGLNYGETFRLLNSNVDTGPDFAISTMAWKPQVYEIPEGQESIIHPALLDASFHPIFAAIESIFGRPLDEPYVPTFIRSLKISGLFMSNATTECTYKVASNTHISGPRIAVTDLRVHSEDENALMIDIQGLEVTALGNDSDSGSDGRSLFFRTRWLPMFDTLQAADVKGLSQLVDIFAHQYPNAKILHLTDNLETTTEVLKLLGGTQGVRRRFKSITPWSIESNSSEVFAPLAEKWGSLVEFEEPKEDDYDLVIVSSPTQLKASDMVKDGGIVINISDMDSQGLSNVFRSPQFTAWRKQSTEVETAKKVAVVLSETPSAKTLEIVSAIESTQGSPVIRQTIAQAARLTAPCDSLVILTSLDENLLFENAPSKSSDFEAIQKLLTEATCDIVWLTEGATLESSRPEQGLIQGLARTVRTEFEDLRLVVLDVEVGSNALDISRHALDVVNSPTKEDEYSVRNGTVLIPRVGADDSLNSKLPNGISREATLQKLYQPGRSLALKIGKVGLLETLAFSDNEDIAKPLLDNELEIDCKASAINFRDIAASMGIIDDFRLGDECAGIVLKVGKDVDPAEFQVGDRVVALRPGQGAHATVVHNLASWCYRLNSGIPFSIAAALPCILVTAYYSFAEVARLTKGETVLIHAAAGGVGQMAIQVAQMLGANIIVTVGSQPKRDLVIEKFGLRDDQIFNSRDDSFVRGVMKVTNGRGVDVALNSLAGKLLHATWKCIAPFGRFIEIGKRDIHENSKIGMDQFRTSVSFASVDLITMFEKNKPLGARMLKECCKLVHEGIIVPPYTVSELSYAEAEKGFRLLQMGKHTGKVVLVPGKDDMVPVLPQSYNNTALFRGDKTYLVIGGLGGLGRTLAEFLVRKGARNLAMFSRSGTSRPEAQDTVDWLRARNVNVKVFSGDVANYETVQKCIKELGSSLAGIFQAAMVLQDAPFEKMTYKQWQTGMSPKVQGTYNLHKATLELGSQLDFFICFSSVSGILGGLAQANYSAANNYLDALMAHRRSLGLAASTMNCGMIVGVGAVSENAGLQAFMERMGYDGVVEEELFYQIEEAVKGSTGTLISENGTDMHQTVTGFNLKRDDLPCSLKPLFSNLYQNHDFKGTSAQGKDGGKKLSVVLSSAATVEERIVILTDAFIEKIAAVLAVPSDNILPSNRLAAYGLDSIVAVEFRKWFSKVVGVELAVFDILGATSIHSLVVKAAADVVQASAIVEKDVAVGAKTTTAVAATKNIDASQTVLLTDIARLDRPAEVPMSSFQRRLWFIHNLVLDRSFLNISSVTAVLGKPDFPAFQLAIQEMVKRNDILRTSFYEGDNIAEQSVLSTQAMGINVDFRDFSESTHPEAALEAYVFSIKEQELDIEEGEVIKFSLVKLHSERFSFVVVYHHIAFDRGSANPFLEQFTSIYDAIRSSTDLSTIPAPRVSYSDFTIWHNARLQSDTLQNSVEFWKNKLSGSSGVSSLLPFAKCTRPEEMDYKRAEVSSVLPLKALNRMKRLCTGAGVTPFHFLMAAFRSFLYRYTEEEDLTVQMIDGNRPHPDVQDTIGFFVNMIPIRSTLDGDGQNRFDQLLEQTKMQTLEALQHNKVPFDVIVDSVDVPKDLSVFPLGQVVVNYQMHGTIPTYTTKDFTMSSTESEDVPSACEIALETLEDPELGLKLRLEYSTTLYGSEDMERFMENFLTFLSSTIKDHRQPLTEIEMCGPLELEYQKKHFWGTETVADQWAGESVIEKIYKNALKTPAAVAVTTSNGASITYSDLMTKAKKVSAALRNASAAPGSSIGLFCQPGVDAISGMLGALLNRSGYVALDPNFAPERLSFMVKDSSINIVLVGDGLMDAAIKIGTHTGTQPELIALAATGDLDIEGMGPPTANPHDPFFTIYTSVSGDRNQEATSN